MSRKAHPLSSRWHRGGSQDLPRAGSIPGPWRCRWQMRHRCHQDGRATVQSIESQDVMSIMMGRAAGGQAWETRKIQNS